MSNVPPVTVASSSLVTVAPRKSPPVMELRLVTTVPLPNVPPVILPEVEVLFDTCALLNVPPEMIPLLPTKLPLLNVPPVISPS